MSWKSLVRHTASTDEIATIAVSHLHRDHYVGLLKPLPNVRHDLSVVLGAIPKIVGGEGLGNALFWANWSIASLDPHMGPIDLDLVLHLRRSAPNLKPNLVCQGDTFNAAGEEWSVLWPPQNLSLGTRGLTTIKTAVRAYEEAEEKVPGLKERREKMQDSETYELLIKQMERPVDGPVIELGPDWEEFEESGTSDESDEDTSKWPDDLSPNAKDALEKADKLLRKAANHLSLVLLSDSGILLTGDASPSAMKAALGKPPYPCTVVQTPHHGGRSHVPESVKNRELSSKFWVSSAGTRLAQYIDWEHYNFRSWHLATCEDGDIEIVVDNGLVIRIRTSSSYHWYGRRFVDYPIL